MQAYPPLSAFPSSNSHSQEQFAEAVSGIGEYLVDKLEVLKVSDDENISEEHIQLTSESQAVAIGGDDEDGGEDDFSFVCNSADAPISADDVFQNGQIRPLFPLFNQKLFFGDDDSLTLGSDLPLRPPVRKVFVETPASEAEEIESVSAGPYCAWTEKAVDASPEMCKKSNSTGFSKLRRFRDLIHRSNSDGRDAFVFFNGSTSTAAAAKREEKADKREASLGKKIAGEIKENPAGGKVKAKKGGKGEKASLSAHQLHYMRNRATREEDRRRSYLPYRPELLGFFTNVKGGLSRNVHPF